MIKPELFDEAIGELPASTIDVSAIVARQERRKAARRGSAAVLGVTTLVLAISVVAGLGLKAPPLNSQAGVVPRSSPAVESAEAKAARVKAAWLRAAAKVLPNATWRAGHDGSFEKPSRADYFDEVAGPKPPEMFTLTNDIPSTPADHKQWVTGDYIYHTFGIVKVGANQGRFSIRTVWRGNPDHRTTSTCSTGSDGVLTCGDDFFCIAHAVCERFAGPNGEAGFISLETQQFPEYKLPYKSLWIWMRSADGTRTIEMTIENRAGGDRGPEPVTTELALTQEQIMRILFEPGLMI